MDLIFFLIFAVIVFHSFKGFRKVPPKPEGPSAKELMARLNAEVEKASQLQKEKPHNSRSRDLTPTQRGRESLASNGKSPWGDKGKVYHGLGVAAKQLNKQKTARKLSNKSPIQRGRRGRNVDQNRHRTEEWGQRGDRSIASARNVIIILVVGGAILYTLSQLPAI